MTWIAYYLAGVMVLAGVVSLWLDARAQFQNWALSVVIAAAFCSMAVITAIGLPRFLRDQSTRQGFRLE
jgi:hypothetical protein